MRRSTVVLLLVIAAGCGESAYSQIEKAKAAWRSGDLLTALAYAEKAVKEHPEYREAWMVRGALYSKKDRREEAVLDFTEAIRIKPGKDAYECRAATYRVLGLNDLAAEDEARAKQFP